MKFCTQLINLVLPVLYATNLLILDASAFQVTPKCRQHDLNRSSSKDAPQARMRISSELALFQDFSNEDLNLNGGDDDHESFLVSESDLLRIQQQYERKQSLPIIIIDTAILPNQTLEITSSDPKLNSLIDYVLQSTTSDELGILGLNPRTKSPLNIGVTAKVTKENVRNALTGTRTGAGTGAVISLQTTGQRRFEIEEQPYLHDSGSFYMAHVEIVEDREEIMSMEQCHEAEKLSRKLPSLVQKWKQLVYSQSTTVKRQVNYIMETIGPMPGNDHIGKRALWVGSLVNPHPLPEMELCSEIRPALLSCKNNYQRIYLAVLSLQSSIDYLSDRKRSA